MDLLPAEIQAHVCSYLSRADLLSLRSTCISLAAAARQFLFEKLTFHGDDENSPRDVFSSEASNLKHPVELTSLEATVDEVIRLGILRFVKEFRYGPKHYVNGFWPHYRDWVEEWAIESFDPENVQDDDSDAWDDDEEWGYVGVRRYAEARRRRPEDEHEVIARAEPYWNAKIAEQDQKEDVNHTALVRLFKSMPGLSTLQLLKWSCGGELSKLGIKGHIDEEVECQFSEGNTLNLHLETLGSALNEAKVDIKRLFLPTVQGRFISNTPAVQHLFSTLSSLSLHLEDPLEMLADYAGPLPVMGELIRRSRCTLERLEFHNPSHLPARGEHLLEKLWGVDSVTNSGALIFPQLKHFQVRTMIFFAPSLIEFLAAQPSLKSAAFTDVYLQTPGYGWSDLAAALPLACHQLGIFRCGGQSTPKVTPDPSPHLDIAYNHISDFDPHGSDFQTISGWSISESYLWQEAEKQACMELSLIPARLAAIVRKLNDGQGATTELPFDLRSGCRVDPRVKLATLVKGFRDGTLAMNSAEYVRV